MKTFFNAQRLRSLTVVLLCVCSALTLAAQKDVILPLNHTWDFTQLSSQLSSHDKELKTNGMAYSTNDGGFYHYTTAQTDANINTVPALQGLRFTVGTDARFYVATTKPSVRMWPQDAVRVPVVKGQQVSFTIACDTYRENFEITQNGTILTSGNIYTVATENAIVATLDAPATVTATATADGYVEFKNTSTDNGRTLYLMQVEVSITPPCPTVSVDGTDYATTGATITHNGMGVDVDMTAPASNWYIWYKWSSGEQNFERFYKSATGTEDANDRLNPTTRTTATVDSYYIGSEANRYLNVVALNDVAGTDVTYMSAVNTVHFTYDENTAFAAIIDYPAKAPWSFNNEQVTANEEGTAYANSGSGSRSAALNWSIDSSYDTYVIEFDAGFKINGYYNGHELVLGTVASNVKNNNAYSGSDALLKVVGGSDATSYTINGTDATMSSNTYYHYQIVVNKTLGLVKCTVGSKSVTVNLPTGADAISLRALVPRNGSLLFKNFKVEVPMPGREYVLFATKAATANIIDMWFDEPDLIVSPAGATLTIESSNPTVAKVEMKDDGSHDVMMLNGGRTTITASITGSDGNTISDSYKLTVIAPEATYQVVGNTYRLTGSGKLSERAVTMIPGIRMEFGDQNLDDENITIVRNEGDELGMMATTLDGHGWRYMRPTRNAEETAITNPLPTQGTFYKFEPTVNGELTLTGARYSGSATLEADKQPVVMWDVTANPNDHTTAQTLIDADGLQTADNIRLTGGHTYYIYCPVPEDVATMSGWSMFRLQSFSYVTDFRFAETAYTKQATELNGFKQDLVNPESGVEFNYVAKGNLTVDFDKTTGTINSVTAKDATEDMGGAIIVSAEKEGFVARYVVTVPYATHYWDFTRVDQGGMEALRDEVDDWAVTYKVRSYEDDTRMLYYLNKPVLSNNVAVHGDNALFIDETAGLVFNSAAKNFGTNVEPNDAHKPTPADVLNERVENNEIDVNSAEYTAALDAALHEMLNYSKNDVETPNVISTSMDNTITIPALKAGQYIVMHVNRHSGRSGEHIEATNIEDLSGKTIGSDFGFTGIRTDNQNRPYHGEVVGAYVFRVKADGDVTMRVSDVNGWLDIYNLRVTPVGQYDGLMMLQNSNKQEVNLTNTAVLHTGPITPDAPVTVDLLGGFNNSRYPRASHEQMFLYPSEGITLDKTVSDMLYNDNFSFTITSATKPGIIKVVQKAYDSSDSYVVNMKEDYIAVGFVEPQSYPHTWDFTARNMAASPAESVLNSRTALAHQLDMGQDDDAKTYGAWLGDDDEAFTQATASVVADAGNNAQGRPLFVSGAQLTTGTEAITETIGLGIGITIDDSHMSGVELDGTRLYFPAAGFITIPAVEAGNYIYFHADKAPTAITGAVETTTGDFTAHGVIENAGSVWGYRTTAQGDVTLSLPEGTEVYRIGVTDVVKNINRYGFATESRAHAVDHTLTGDFTLADVNAHIITSYDKDRSRVTLTEADVIPAGTGVVLYNASASVAAQSPLFVPACNIMADDMTGNLMQGHVTEGNITATEGNDVNFVFTNIAHYLGDSQVITSDRREDVGFYVSTSGTLAANSAYLQLPLADVNEAAGGIVFIEGQTADDRGHYTRDQILADTSHSLTVNTATPKFSVSTSNVVKSNQFAGPGGPHMGFGVALDIELPSPTDAATITHDATGATHGVQLGAGEYVYCVRVWREADGQESVLLNNEESITEQDWKSEYDQLLTFMPQSRAIGLNDVFVAPVALASGKADYVVRVYTVHTGLVADPDRSFAPRRVPAAPSTTAPFADQDYDYSVSERVITIDFSDRNIPTAISDVDTAREVDEVRYYDLGGHTSLEPFDGLNIVVTRYSDGTITTGKLIK